MSYFVIILRMLGNFTCFFLSSTDLFSNKFFPNTIRVSNNLDSAGLTNQSPICL